MLLLTLPISTGCDGTRPASDASSAPESLAHPGADGDGWASVPAESLSTLQQAQLASAQAARIALETRLKAELMAAIGESGPAHAVDFCSTTAPRIASEVSQGHALSIGRTSFRLRNPDNQPPAWFAPVLQERIQATSVFVSDQHEMGVAYPIMLADACVMCHGQLAQLTPNVRNALAQAYPLDEATGFAPGDLRGWFWVQVPAID